MARMDLLTALERVRACDDAKAWLQGERARKPNALKSQERWDACERADWLLWLAAKANVDRKALVMASCACARLALKYVPAWESRPLAAIEMAERWCRGEATLAEVMAVRDACWRSCGVAASASYVASDAAGSEMRKACANEVRKRIKWSDVERGLFLAAGGVL